MNIQKKHSLLLIVPLLVALLLVSGCSSPVGGTGTSTLTVLQVLQNSANAMKQLKSAHIELKATGSMQ